MITARERFLQISRFERPNDPCLYGLATWTATVRRWRREGIPEGMSPRQVLTTPLDGRMMLRINAVGGGMGNKDNGAMYGPALDPYFEPEVLEETEDYLIKKDKDGSTLKLNKKEPGNMPQWLDYPVKNRKDWEKYKKRLDPHSPGRWPDGWDKMPDGKDYSERKRALAMNTLSLYGCARYYMGLKNLSIAMYDDPTLVEDIVEWQAHFSLEILKKVFAAGITIDSAQVFEDMCYKTASLVSPRFVKEVMVPRYRRVVGLLRDHGVDIIILDSDGNVDELLPIWLDCGINGFYPFEVAAGMDGVEIRKKYGKNIIICGNIDKRALAKGKAEIDAEIEKCRVLLQYGGFFPSVDHHIPPDVPLRNMVYFLNELRKLSHYPETRHTIELDIA